MSIRELKFSDVTLRYDCPNAVADWRVSSLFKKEPVTVEWISTFTKDDVFVDVGANIGLYTILAAKLSGCKVYAFEPEAENFACLNRNILLNQLDELVIAYPVALARHGGYGSLYLSRPGLGESCHSVDPEHDYKGDAFAPAFRQGTVLESLHSFHFSPTRIKIDVDGLEPEVVRGALNMLDTVHSMLIEVNPALASHRDMVSRLVGLGFDFDREQVKRSTRMSGPFLGVAEYLFYKAGSKET